MPHCWMDSDSFIIPHRGPYRFEALPQFWDFLEQKAQEGIIGSPAIILDKELSSDRDDEQDVLARWARRLKNVLFLVGSEEVKSSYAEVVQYVQGNIIYRQS